MKHVSKSFMVTKYKVWYYFLPIVNIHAVRHCLIYWPKEDLVLIVTTDKVMEPPDIRCGTSCQVKTGKKTVNAGVIAGIGYFNYFDIP